MRILRFRYCFLHELIALRLNVCLEHQNISVRLISVSRWRAEVEVSHGGNLVMRGTYYSKFTLELPQFNESLFPQTLRTIEYYIYKSRRISIIANQQTNMGGPDRTKQWNTQTFRKHLSVARLSFYPYQHHKPGDSSRSSWYSRILMLLLGVLHWIRFDKHETQIFINDQDDT